MGNRRLEVFHYRQALHLMRQKQSDRAIAKSGLMGRGKVAQVRIQALNQGWLEPGAKLPDDATLAALFDQPKKKACLLYTSPSPRDQRGSRMPSSA